MFANRFLQRAGVAFGVTLVVLLVFPGGTVESLEDDLLDAIMRTRGALPGDPRIVLCEIDAPTVRALGPWPWSSRTLAELIDGLELSGASIVGFGERTSPPATAAREHRSKNSQPTVVGGYFLASEATDGSAIDASSSAIDASSTPGPTERSTSVSIGTHRGFLDLFTHQENLRYLPLATPQATTIGTTSLPSLPMAIVDAVRHRQGSIPVLSSRASADPEPHTTWVPPLELAPPPSNALRLLNIDASGYCRASALDIVRGNSRPPCWPVKNAIVLVGFLDDPGQQRFRTPFTDSASRLVLHAQAVDMLLNRHRIRQPRWPWLAAAASIFVVNLLTLVIVLECRRLGSGLALALGTLLLAPSAGFATLAGLTLQWPSATPAAIGLVTMLVTVAYRTFFQDGPKRRLHERLLHRVDEQTRQRILRTPENTPFPVQRRSITLLQCRWQGVELLDLFEDPAHAVGQWNQALDALREVAVQAGGTLGPVTADGFMLLFGAPIVRVTHRRRACLAALRLQARFSQTVAAWQADGHPTMGPNEPRLYVAIYCGAMTVGPIGTQAGASYAPIGTSVPATTRLLELAAAHDCPILVSDAVERQLRAHFLFRTIGTRSLTRYLPEAPIFELVAESSCDAALVLRARAFEEAVKRAQQHDYAGAASACEALLAHDPRDGPARALLADCRERRPCAERSRAEAAE